jgi:hypothetical protein
MPLNCQGSFWLGFYKKDIPYPKEVLLAAKAHAEAETPENA